MLLPLGAKALLQTDSGGGLISVSVSFLVHLFSHYIILNNGILKSNSSIFPRSQGYITQYTPQGVYRLIVNKNNEVNIFLMIVKII